MPGQWIELPDGRWDWDTSAPNADESPTLIQAQPQHEFGNPRRDPAMSSYDPIPSSREVFDPTIGADGGQGGALPSIDPDCPVGHVDELGDGPDPGDVLGGQGGAPSLVPCPTCGTGVHPDRLRN